jgi:hypothetical protein
MKFDIYILIEEFINNVLCIYVKNQETNVEDGVRNIESGGSGKYDIYLSYLCIFV